MMMSRVMGMMGEVLMMIWTAMRGACGYKDEQDVSFGDFHVLL